MDKNQKQITRLENRIREEERNFLIEAYARQLVQVLQENSETPDAKTLQSLIIALPRVAADLSEQISNLLEANGHEIDWKTTTAQSGNGDGLASLADVVDDDGSVSVMGVLFDDVELSDEEKEVSCSYEEVAEEDEEDSDGLFDSDSELEDGKDKEYETERDGDEEGLFGDDDEAETEAARRRPRSRKRK